MLAIEAYQVIPRYVAWETQVSRGILQSLHNILFSQLTLIDSDTLSLSLKSSKSCEALKIANLTGQKTYCTERNYIW